MIFTILLTILITPLTSLFEFLPDLPQTPLAIVNAGEFLITQLLVPFTIISYVYGEQFFAALILVSTALLIAEASYWTALFILRKIPFINIY